MEEDRKPIVVRGGEIECVKEFPYFGSVIMSNGRLHSEVDRNIASASRAFGELCKAVFDDDNLSVTTKRKVHKVCILSETLDSTAQTPGKIRQFSSQVCLYCAQDNKTTTVGAENHQWVCLKEVVWSRIKGNQKWLGHMARMPDYRVPTKSGGCQKLTQQEDHTNGVVITYKRILSWLTYQNRIGTMKQPVQEMHGV